MPDQTGRGVHLNGSVPLENAEAVFRALSTHLGDSLTRMPDGETGERTNWVQWQYARILSKHPALEPTGAAPDSYQRVGAMKIKADATDDDLAFGPLGYAEAAKESYGVFRRLRKDGVIPDGMRFQVSMPTPLAPIGGFIAPDDLLRLEKPYEAAIMREVAEIAEAIPHKDLAIQWDTAREFMFVEGLLALPEGDLETFLGSRAVRQAEAVPDNVELGYHLCYGDRDHKHFMEPKDAGNLTAVANLIADRVKRPIQFIHMPVPRDRSDDGYYEPLRLIRLHPETRLFLGLVHATDGIDGARKRVEAAAKSVDDFGVSTECGLGRRPPDTVPALLDLLAEASRL